MKKIILALALSCAAVTSSFGGPIEDREAIMKAMGKAVGSVAPIAKGEAPFDATAVAAALTTISETAAKIDVAVLFPEGSTNAESTAGPKIWEDMAGFQAAVDKFKADTAAAAATPPADLAAFQTAFGAVTQNCGACHQVYRIKKE